MSAKAREEEEEERRGQARGSAMKSVAAGRNSLGRALGREASHGRRAVTTRAATELSPKISKVRSRASELARRTSWPRPWALGPPEKPSNASDSLSLSLSLQIEPKGPRIVVKVAELEKKTLAGILLPDSSQKKPTSGKRRPSPAPWSAPHLRPTSAD